MISRYNYMWNYYYYLSKLQLFGHRAISGIIYLLPRNENTRDLGKLINSSHMHILGMFDVSLTLGWRRKLSLQEGREQGERALRLVTRDEMSRSSYRHKCQVLVFNRITSNLAFNVPGVPWSLYGRPDCSKRIPRACNWDHTICISTAGLYKFN